MLYCLVDCGGKYWSWLSSFEDIHFSLGALPSFRCSYGHATCRVRGTCILLSQLVGGKCGKVHAILVIGVQFCAEES